MTTDRVETDGPVAPPPPAPTPPPEPPVSFDRSPLAEYGSWPWVLGTLGAVLLALLALSVFYAAGRAAVGRPAASATSPALFFLLIVLEDAIFLTAVYLLLIRRRVVTWGELGLRRSGAGRAAIAGLGWGVLFIIVAGILEYILGSLGVRQTQAAEFPLQGASALGVAGILVAGVAFAPFAEEVFFRGYVYRAMSERKGVLRGVVYSSALFGAVHWNLGAFLPIAAGAVLLALSFRRTNHLLTPIVAHALNNAFAFALLLLTRGS